METPFFSIITCTYNSEKYLKENIDSLKNQKFRDFEQIFVDANSSDKTIDILNDYKSGDERIVIVQSPPKGIANAMNIGINNAHGKFLLFLNSDDYLFDNLSLEKVNNAICKNNNYTWFYGMVNAISEKGDSLYIYPHRKYQKSFYYWMFRFTYFMQHPATFYSRELFEKYGLYNEELNAMDYEYAVRIGKNERAKFIDVVVSKFRVGGFSYKNKDIMEKDDKTILNKYFSSPGLWLFLGKMYRYFFVKNY